MKTLTISFQVTDSVDLTSEFRAKVRELILDAVDAYSWDDELTGENAKICKLLLEES